MDYQIWFKNLLYLGGEYLVLFGFRVIIVVFSRNLVLDHHFSYIKNQRSCELEKMYTAQTWSCVGFTVC